MSARPIPNNQRATRRVRRSAGALAVLGLATAAMSGVARPAHADTAAPIDAKRIFAQSEPATVLMEVDFAADATVPTAVLNQQALQQELIAEVQGGKLDPNDAAGLFNRSIQLLIAAPDTFLVEGPPRQAKAQFGATGSGFIIDESGYIVTNAHVAAPHDDEIKQQLTQIGLKQMVADDVKGMQTELQNAGVQLPNDLLQGLVDADANWLAKRIQVSNLQKNVSVTLGATVPGVTTTLKPIHAEVVAAGDPIPGRDVAVVKIEQRNLPTLPLGDDQALKPGDKVYVIGYPGAATFHELISQESYSEPTFTAGQMSARKTATGGFEVVQIDATINHGNSGGPVFNDKGEVVGIATFGSFDQTTQTPAAGFNFIMPTTLVKQFVDRSGAHPKESLFTTLYKKGLDQEAAGKAKVALATFEEINQMSPGHPYVQQHIASDQSLVATGKGGSSDSSDTGLIVGIGAAVALLLGGLVVFLTKARSKTATVSGPAAAFAAPSAPTQVTATMPMASVAPGATPLPSAGSATTAVMEVPATAIQRFCGSCGAPLNGQRFCGSCGQPAV